MYHQITTNKRKSVVVIVGFLAVWLAAGALIGLIATADTTGAIGGAIALGVLGVLAALYAYYLDASTVLSAMGNTTTFDVRLLLIVTTMIGMAAIISSVFWRGALRMNLGRGRNSGQAMLIIFAIGIVFTLIAFLVGPLMQLALSRDRESLADVSGVELTRNPVGLINALKKIAANDKPPEKFNHAVAAMCIDNPEEHHGSFCSRLFKTQPPIEERIATLEKIASVQQT